jgi:hypothetical protein
MSIEKKSLISTLKSAKKANVAGSLDSEAKGSKVSSTRVIAPRPAIRLKGVNMKSAKINMRQQSLKSTRSVYTKAAK